MSERIVVVGDLLWNSQDDDSYWGDRKDEYGLFDRYKEEWVQEVMDNDPDEEFKDDLFTSYDEYMEFWGTSDLESATGSVSAKKYDDFTDEDEKFYKKLVDDAEEKNMWGQKQKKNIMILEPTDWNYKNVESRCDYEWEQNKK